MARPGRLKQPRGATVPLAVIAAVVLVGHAAALEWLARRQLDPPALRPLAEPMFTRLLQPQAPPPAPVSEPKRPVASARPAARAIETVAPTPSVPATPTVTASPEPREPEPEVAEQVPAPEVPDPAAAGSSAQAVPAPDVPAVPPPEPVASAPVEATPSATASAQPNLDTWPRDTRLNYQLSGKYRSGDLYGGARVQWQRENNRYQARVELDITLAGSRVLTSQGEVTADGLLPNAFEERRGNSRRAVRMDGGVLTFNDGRTAPRPDGVQDSASQFVELSHRFATGRETLEVGRAVEIWMARPGHVDLWTYDIVDRERLRTPRLGEVDAFRLKPRPLPSAKGNITAEIWFAPALQYLPVRIRVSMGDEAHVDLMVDTIEQR